MMTKCHLLILALAAPTAACYSYVDNSFETVAPGSEIRVEVTPETSTRLRDALAADRQSMEGRVRSREDGALLLDVVTTTRQMGFQFKALRQTLHLERADVTRVQIKTLDRGRSIAAVALSAAFVGALTWKVLGGKVGGDTRSPTGEGPADARIVRPLFRIPVPFS